MVVVSLLSLIVLALMAVFTSTQRAFRAAVTQTDVLEGSRAAMDLMASDLRGVMPSMGTNGGAVNFAVLANYNYYVPLIQSLPGTVPTVYRTNLLNYFFVLSRQNTKWTGTGYVVDNTNTTTLYPLYRYYCETNLSTDPGNLFNNFFYAVKNSEWTNMSHLVDGVVHLTVHAFDTNGNWMNFTYALNTNNSTFFSSPPLLQPGYGEAQFYMYSNAVPAAVEFEMGVLEDRALARAQSLPFQSAAQTSYLAQQAGVVHVFRQRVSIPNVDPSAYQ